MSEQIFTYEQVERLWKRQFGPWDGPFGNMRNVHPYTCGNRSDHPDMAGDKGVLVPTVHGWICPFCDYKQDWAHGFDIGSK
jgi:hypothetical protein